LVTLGVLEGLRLLDLAVLFSKLEPASVGILPIGMGFVLYVVFFIWYRYSLRRAHEERELDIEQESVAQIETELRKYVTLLATDLSLREYQKHLQKDRS
jgi:hypothetical protein